MKALSTLGDQNKPLYFPDNLYITMDGMIAAQMVSVGRKGPNRVQTSVSHRSGSPVLLHELRQSPSHPMLQARRTNRMLLRFLNVPLRSSSSTSSTRSRSRGRRSCWAI